MATLLELENITKKYGKKTVLNGISYSFEEGGIYGLVGNNGVGKTTLLRLICGLASPSSGSVKFAKPNVSIGALVESPAVFKDMSAYENLRAKALVRGYNYTKQQLVQLLNDVGLENTSKPVIVYSTGMKQRLGIAMALLDNPELLILDEPINGLDPKGIADVRQLIKKIHAERASTILISSHILNELLRVATHFLFIKDGRIVYEISVQDLMKELGDGDINDYYLSILSKE